MTASFVESAGILLTILTPLVAVPLTVITFYLRSLREHQLSWHDQMIRRVEAAEDSLVGVRKMLADFERDYTTKEEWLRECMLARRTFEQLSESTIRIETQLESFRAVRPREMQRQRAKLDSGTGATRENRCDAGSEGGR